jgi:hypothetical protein
VKTISKGTHGNEILADSNVLLNPCEYPEEISQSKEKKKKPFTYQKYKKEKKK